MNRSILALSALLASMTLANSGLALSLPANMPTDELLLKVRAGSGFVPQANSYSIECEINENEVVLQVRRGLEKTPTYKSTEVDNRGLKPMIAAAANGVVTSYPAPMDIGVNSYVAYQTLSKGKTLMIDLGSTSREITVNSAKEAATLKAIADKYCELAR